MKLKKFIKKLKELGKQPGFETAEVCFHCNNRVLEIKDIKQFCVISQIDINFKKIKRQKWDKKLEKMV